MPMTQRQLAFLFATGILKSSGGGGKGGRTVTYNKARAKEVRALSGKGRPSSTFRKKASAGVGKGAGSGKRMNGPAKFERTVIGGKSAHLRGAGTGSGKKRVPSKAERDATRAKRVADGKKEAVTFMARTLTAEANTQRSLDHKVMSSKYPGRYRDTGESFEAGAKIHYVRGEGAYKHQPKRRVREVVFDLERGSGSRVAQAAAAAKTTQAHAALVKGNRLRTAGQAPSYTSAKRQSVGLDVDSAFTAVRSGVRGSGLQTDLRRASASHRAMNERRRLLASEIRAARKAGDKARLKELREVAVEARWTAPRRLRGYRATLNAFVG